MLLEEWQRALHQQTTQAGKNRDRYDKANKTIYDPIPKSILIKSASIRCFFLLLLVFIIYACLTLIFHSYYRADKAITLTMTNSHHGTERTPHYPQTISENEPKKLKKSSESHGQRNSSIVDLGNAKHEQISKCEPKFLSPT